MGLNLCGLRVVVRKSPGEERGSQGGGQGGHEDRGLSAAVTSWRGPLHVLADCRAALGASGPSPWCSPTRPAPGDE